MNRTKRLSLWWFAGFAALGACQGHGQPTPTGSAVLSSDETDLLQTAAEPRVIHKKLADFAPAELGPPPAALDDQTRHLVAKLVEAADELDHVFWQQLSEDGLRLFQTLRKRSDPRSRDIARLMRIHAGPWDAMKDDEPFIGSRMRPEGANLYPPDVSRREIERWVQANPEQNDALHDPYSILRRKGEGFVVIKYSQAYGDALDRAAQSLREAALFSPWSSLGEFLRTRADALLQDAYYESDMAWMQTDDAQLEVVFGPYEYYEDRLFGYKTVFEAIIAVKDFQESAKLRTMTAQLDGIEKALPLPDNLKERVRREKPTPPQLADVVYAAGYTRAGPQTTAFSLPNDERVRRQFGTKKVILRNVAQAKFLSCWQPLVSKVIAPDQATQVTFDSYFHLLLMTDVHGIYVAEGAGAQSPPLDLRPLLKNRNQVMQELSRDMLGLYSLLYLAQKGVVSKKLEQAAAVTYLASIFRVVRFGIQSAFGTARLIAFNYLAEEGVFNYDPTARRFRASPELLRPALETLLSELLFIIGEGDYDRAGRLILRYMRMPGDMAAKLEELRDIPVDIEPHFSFAESLLKP